MHSFEVHSNESACRKKVPLGLEQVSCFIAACSSLRSLLSPPVVTELAAKLVALERTVWPSTLASSSMMRSACALHFSSSAAAYFIADAKLLSAVVAVAPPWGVSMV